MKNKTISIMLRISAIMTAVYFLSYCTKDPSNDASADEYFPSDLSLSDAVIQTNNVLLQCSLDVEKMENSSNLVFAFEYALENNFADSIVVSAQLTGGSFSVELSHYVPSKRYYYRATVRQSSDEKVLISETKAFTAPWMALEVRLGGLTWDADNTWAGDGYEDNNGDWYYTWNQAVSECPTGWRLPSKAEFDNLRSSGSTWKNAGTNTTPENRAGRWLGSNHAKAIASNPGEAVFFPASGYKNSSADDLEYVDLYGRYWASISSGEAAFNLSFNEATVTMGSDNKAFGYSVRCVEGSLPEVSTDEVTGIKETAAIFTGEVISGGDAAMIERGFLYSSVNNPPSIDDVSNTGKVKSSTLDIGEFTSDAADLVAWTTYYVRSYVTNENATVYGDVLTFNTPEVGAPAYVDYYYTAYGGGTYYGYGVKIGNRWWAPVSIGARTPKSDSFYFQFGKKNRAWVKDWDPADNAWNSDTEANPSKTINDPCPDNWRVPTNTEQQALMSASIVSRGGDWRKSHEGVLILTSRTDARNYIELPATGLRYFNTGNLHLVGFSGHYWSSSHDGTDSAKDLHFTEEEATVLSKHGRTYGFPIRCVHN